MKGFLVLGAFAVVLLSSAGRGGAEGGPESLRLFGDLLDSYSAAHIATLPVMNSSDTVAVEFGVGLISIVDVDEINKQLKLNAWLRFKWQDKRLRWSPEEYGGLDTIKIPIERIWKPDMVLYNTVGEFTMPISPLAVVGYNGDVIWIPPVLMTSTCSVDLSNYPFDSGTCHLKFGSWVYDGFKMDINFYSGLEEISVTDFVASNEYELTDHRAVKNVKYYPCCAEPYPDLTFYLGYKRAVHDSFTLMVPILASLMLLLVFWMPPHSICRFLTCLFVFVVLVLLQLHIYTALMQTTKLGNYITSNILLTFFVLLWSVVNWNLSSIRTLPCCFNKIRKCLICCCTFAPNQPCTDDVNRDGVSAPLNSEKAAAAGEPRAQDGGQDGYLLALLLDRLLFVVHLLVTAILWGQLPSP